MNAERSNISASNLHIAESTQIEDSVKTPFKRLKLRLANRFGLRSTPANSIDSPTAKRNSSNTSALNKLDPQVYLDTQSNGFASRVVKYHEASEAKTREIANKAYRRPGDFPIVNLDKSEISLKQKQVNAPKVAKISIAPPINLVSASERSTIFRTGKNYGESYALGPIGKIGPIEGRKPLHTPQSSHDEPIVPTTTDFNSEPPRSSLEALDILSRKRIHCDEIDGDPNKKQRHENIPNDYDQNSVPLPNAAKRTRERTSPSFSSSSSDAQKKRYKNNDILSSLSSSISSTPKRTISNESSTPTKVLRFNHDFQKDANEKANNENQMTSQKPPESSRVGTSNSDLPLHRPSEQIKPVTKSMSDGYVPKQQPPKVPKLTLFDRDYSVISKQKRNDADDDDENGISFVKPKAKTSNLFNLNKSRDSKSKLAMMLSFLRGDESKDEVDSIGSNKANVEKSGEALSRTPVFSTSANLSTNTSVTFSTATTTSVLNAPSDTTKSIMIEPLKNPNNGTSNDDSKPAIPTASVVFPLSTSKSPTSAVATSTSASFEKSQTSESATVVTTSTPVVTFNLAATSSATSIAEVSAANTSNDNVPRLGGFTFSATSTSPSLLAKPVVVGSPSVTKTEEKKPTVPTFSFGQSNATSSATLTTFTTPTFGTNSLAKTEVSAPTLQTSTAVSTNSIPAIFSFGSPKTTTATATSVTSASISNPISFGVVSTSSISSTTNTLGSSNPIFSFGTTAKTTGSSVAVTTSAISSGTTSFVFGTNAPNTSAPTFGLINTATGSTSIQAKPSFSFGAATNTTTNPDTGAFQFGNVGSTAKSKPITFGTPPANATTVPSTNLFGVTTNTSSTPQSAFAFGVNKTEAATKPSLFSTTTTQSSGFGTFTTPTFGQVNAVNAAPTFGSVTKTPATTASNLFGSTSSTQNTPAFGATQSKTENAFGMAANQNAPSPVFGGQNQTNTFGSSINPPTFGATTNLFGNAATTQSQPAFGANASLFSTPTTAANAAQPTNSAFGAPSGVFAFGQSQTSAPIPATTASTGLFGSSNTSTNTNSPFVFGQTNATPSATPSQPTGLFGAKPADTANSSLTAPPAFGSTSPAFNFSAKPMFGNQTDNKPPAFSFNAPNTAPANVSAFGTTPAPAPQFGNTNGIGSSFSFNATTNSTDPSKTFNAFGGPATAPAATPAPFSFSAPNSNAFQFSATPQASTANIFSIGPGSGTNTTKTGRPMRTATRRIK